MTTDEVLQTLVVHVREGARPAEKVIADGPRILIGSGAHCDVCLPPGAAAPEHIEITVNAAGELFAHVLADRPRATLRGAPFRRERITAGDVLAIGSTELDVAIATGDSAGRRSRGGPRRSLVIACAAALGMLALTLGARGSARPPATALPPPLWGPTASSPCPARDPEAALASANELRGRADAKRERLRFAVHEGVKAVDLLERATVCYRAAGQTERAAEASEVSERLRARVTESYRGHQLRLRHALEVDEVDTALREVRILRAMTSAASGPWVAWLTTLDRTLQQRQQRKVGS